MIVDLVLHAVKLLMVGVALYFALAPYLHGRYVLLGGDLIGYSNQNTLKQINSATVTCSTGQVYLTSGLVGVVSTDACGAEGNFTEGCYGSNATTTASELVIPQVCVDENGTTVSITNVSIPFANYSGTIALFSVLDDTMMSYSAVRIGDTMTVTFQGAYFNGTGNASTCAGLAGQEWIFILLPAELQSSSLPTLSQTAVLAAGVMRAGRVTPTGSTLLIVRCQDCGGMSSGSFPASPPCGIETFTLVYPMT
jgi:hypothetical protein